MFAPPYDGPSGDQHTFAMSSASESGKRQAAEMKLQMIRAQQGSVEYDEEEESAALHNVLNAVREDCDFPCLLKYAKQAFHHGCKCLNLADQALAFEAQGHAHYHMAEYEDALTCHRYAPEKRGWLSLVFNPGCT